MKKKITRAISVILLIATGFAAGFPAGSIIGFARGSEWAMVQAEILARESGVFMPVCLNDGDFRVIMKQPRGLYKRAWETADKNSDVKVAASRVEVETEEASAIDKLVYTAEDQSGTAVNNLHSIQQ